MKHTHTKAVVLAVGEAFLSALVEREASLTTLAWGGEGNASRMAEPHRILERDQAHLPFLFSPTGQGPEGVTHAAVCGFLVHRAVISAATGSWLDKRRVENFSGVQHGPEAASLYVVTAAKRLDPAIPHSRLVLARGNEALSPKRRGGYAVVYLPAALEGWFEEACRHWDVLSSELPKADEAPER